jgi:hypothetical protein
VVVGHLLLRRERVVDRDVLFAQPDLPARVVVLGGDPEAVLGDELLVRQAGRGLVGIHALLDPGEVDGDVLEPGRGHAVTDEPLDLLDLARQLVHRQAELLGAEAGVPARRRGPRARAAATGGETHTRGQTECERA